MSRSDDQSLVPQRGSSITPLAHQEVRYRAAPTWTRALLWAMVGTVGFGIIYACIARIDEVVTATGELQALGAERPIKAPAPGVVSAILVKEGSWWRKEQVLLQFDPEVNDQRLRCWKNRNGWRSATQGTRSCFKARERA